MKFGTVSPKSRANFIYGKSPVKSSIEANKVKKLFLQKGFSDESLLKLARTKNVLIEFVDNNVLVSLSKNGNHQGVVAEVEEYKY